MQLSGFAGTPLIINSTSFPHQLGFAGLGGFSMIEADSQG
jgi:hypothetical protein